MNTNQNNALPGSTPFNPMDVFAQFEQTPPVYQHFTGPCSTFINVFRQPGNYSIEMAFGRGSVTNFGQAPQPIPQAVAIRVPTPIPGPSRPMVHPQILNVQAQAARPPSSPAPFAPAPSVAPGQVAFSGVPEGNGEHPTSTSSSLRRRSNKF